MISSSVLSTRKVLKAMAIASTEVGAGLSHSHGEIASIVLPATNLSSALSEVKVAKHVGRRIISSDVAGVVVAIPKAGVPKTREVRRDPRRERRTNLDLGNMIMLIKLSWVQITLKCTMR